MKNKSGTFRISDIDIEMRKLDNISVEVLPQEIFELLDLTSLNITDTHSSIHSLVQRVNRFSDRYPGVPSVAGLCVFPRFVPVVKKHLTVHSVKIVSVAASFPFSQTYKKIKKAECKRAVEEGADEIDIVMLVGDFLEGNTEKAGDEIAELKKASKKAKLKVILETGIIKDPELIYNASMTAMEAGADFIKTSTGKSSVSATPEAVISMCLAISDYHKATGRFVGIKPAGGISSMKDACKYREIVKNLPGNDWLVPDLFRIGASRLANNLLSEMEGNETVYY